MKDKQKYLHYINKSNEWQLKRIETIKLKGNKCQRCSSKKKINIHHATYKRLYEEDVETDLYVLCDGCHNEYHTRTRGITIESTLAFIKNEWFSEKGKPRKRKVGKPHVPKKEKTPEEKEERRFRILYKVELQRKAKAQKKEDRQKKHLAMLEKKRLKKEAKKKITPFEKKRATLILRLETIRQYGFRLTDADKQMMRNYGIEV